MPSSIKKKRKQEKKSKNILLDNFFENNNIDIDTLVKHTHLARERGESAESIFTLLCQRLNVEIDEETSARMLAGLRELDTNGVKT